MSKKFNPRQLLEQQGWSDGKGLGKMKDGITVPIKATLKMDKTGLGHDPSEHLTHNWWDEVFNSASQCIKVHNVESSDDVVRLTKLGDAHVTNKKNSIKKGTNLLYNSFVKCATLDNGIEEQNSDSSDSESEDETRKFSSGCFININSFCLS